MEREWKGGEEQGDHDGSLSPIYSSRRGLFGKFTGGNGRDRTTMSSLFWA
jgi:hypothetical protein